jgi:hypothetical protein
MAQLPAKTCYSHIGGKLGNLLRDTFITKGWIAKQTPNSKHYYITAKGKKGFARLGVDVKEIKEE